MTTLFYSEDRTYAVELFDKVEVEVDRAIFDEIGRASCRERV